MSQDEGNHTWAKSESWAWMGHLNEFTVSNEGLIQLQKNGLALIHFYSRNQTRFGNLNLKSSALTFTKNGIGEFYDKKTLYSEPQQSKNKFQMKIQENQLNLQFQYNEKVDKIKKVSMTERDLHFLKIKLLPIYTGLEVSTDFTPVKYTFSAFVGSESFLNLELYQIWPTLFPKEARMKFLGISDSYTFSQPMLVAYGSFQRKGITKAVVGLFFLDRQWSKDYFGKNIMADFVDRMRQNQALKYSHNWSAFHVRAEDSKNWYFVHLWQQYQRTKNTSDEISDYSGILWVKNGIPQDPIAPDSFLWLSSGFVKNQSQVILNYAVGRENYFPSRYYLKNKMNTDHLWLQASPSLQSLDQPIYLYEGYASGAGIWNGERVKLQGRVESSRVFFRVQDYLEILEGIKQTRDSKGDLAQKELGQHLEKIINDERRCRSSFLCFKHFLQRKKAQVNYVFNDLRKKINIFHSGFKSKGPEPDPLDPSVIVYH